MVTARANSSYVYVDDYKYASGHTEDLESLMRARTELMRPDNPYRDWVGAIMQWNKKGLTILETMKYSKPKKKLTVNRFTEEQIQQILKLRNDGVSAVKIAEMYGCHRTSIHAIVKESKL